MEDAPGERGRRRRAADRARVSSQLGVGLGTALLVVSLTGSRGHDPLESPAGDALYLVARAYVSAAGTPVTLSVLGGPDDRPRRRSWPGDAIRWFFARGTGCQTNRETVLASPATPDRVIWTPARSGTTVFGLDLEPREIVRPAGIRTTERCSAKLLVRRGRFGQGSGGIATAKTGQAAEIRPLADPTRLRAGSDLPLTFYTEGMARSGARIVAFGPGGQRVGPVTTGPAGTVSVRLPRVGIWRIVARARVEPSPESNDRYILYTGSLTFELPRRDRAPAARQEDPPPGPGAAAGRSRSGGDR